MVEQVALQIPFVGIIAKGQKIEVVRIFGNVLRQVGLWSWKGAVRVSHGLSLTMLTSGLDLMHQHVTAPSMLDGCLGIPDTILRGGQLVEHCQVLVPGDLCKHSLHKCLIRPRLCERTHIFQVAGRESLDIGEGPIQAVDYLGAPALPFLPVEDVAADLPIQ